jgi:hypothetical protein
MGNIGNWQEGICPSPATSELATATRDTGSNVSWKSACRWNPLRILKRNSLVLKVNAD